VDAVLLCDFLVRIAAGANGASVFHGQLGLMASPLGGCDFGDAGWITQFPEFALALHYLAVRACDDVVWVDALDVLTSRHRLVFGAYLAT
jgi:hypothetical protein